MAPPLIDGHLRPLGLTFVLYEDGDKFGKLMALASLAPFFAVCAIVTHLVFRREIHTLFFLVGSLSNEILNKILKDIFNEPRPGSVGTGSGMPSNHAQFTGFILIYLHLFLFLRPILSPKSRTEISQWRWAQSLFITGSSLVVLFGRVYLNYHTVSQVVVGAAFGGVYAIVLFFLIETIGRKYLFPAIEEWRISRFFYLRDSSNTPSTFALEYAVNRAARAKPVSKEMASLLASVGKPKQG